jgi:hypothetical protein
MSLQNYLKRKSERNVVVSLEAFEEKLKADLSSLIMKPNEKISEVKKNSINLFEVSSFLKKIKFPLVLEFEVAVKSLNSKKMKKVRQIFSNWSRNKNINKNECFKVESSMIQYEMNLYREDISPEQIDLSIESLLKESNLVLLKIKNKILKASEKCGLENFDLHLKALESNDFILNEIKVLLGNFLEFTVNSQFEVKDVFCEEVSSKLQEKAGLFLEFIALPSDKRIITLYFESNDDNFLLNKKRELSLGFKTCIPNYFDFSISPKEGNNVWKIKAESKYLIENESGFISLEDLPILWIDKNEK